MLQLALPAQPPHAVQVSACLVSDCDSDGVRDLLVGAAEGAGVVCLVSGKTLEVIKRIPAPEGSWGFGWAVTELGDRTGDGIAEWAVGAPGFGCVEMALSPPDRMKSPGEVLVFDGKSFAMLGRTRGSHDGDGFGACLDGGVDWDHDGNRDLLVGAPEGKSDRGGYVQVVNTDTRVPGPTIRAAIAMPKSLEISRSQFGCSACFVSDFDRDGFADIVVGAPDELLQRKPWRDVDQTHHLRGEIVLVSSRTGAPLSRREGSAAGMQFGVCVVPYPLGLETRGPGFIASSLHSRTELFAGMRIDPVFSVETPRPAYMECFGSSVCVLGDLDGDGTQDLAIGMLDALGLDWHSSPILFVVSGRSGAKIRVHEGREFGVLACRMGDLDGDKVEDYCMIHCDQTLRLEVFSGKSGARIRSGALAGE